MSSRRKKTSSHPDQNKPASRRGGRQIPKGAHQEDPSLDALPRTIFHLPRLLLLWLIRGYQATFSRTLPMNVCRFYPSCSHYGYQAIYKYGVFKGGLMAAWRILRCNPFNPGGYDPVP